MDTERADSSQQCMGQQTQGSENLTTLKKMTRRLFTASSVLKTGSYAEDVFTNGICRFLSIALIFASMFLKQASLL